MEEFFTQRLSTVSSAKSKILANKNLKKKKSRGGNSCDLRFVQQEGGWQHEIKEIFLHDAMNASIVVTAIWKSNGLAAQLRKK